MRVCLFSPDVGTLSDNVCLERVRALVGAGGHELVRLTNSWADPPHDTYTTGAARTWSMRVLRRALDAGIPIACLTGRALGPLARPALVEGLRAADADVIVCTTRAAAAQLRTVLGGVRMPWPCTSVETLERPQPADWRRYDATAKVSIVLPTFNGTRFLREAIASCLAQTHQHLELIVVDDGSTEPVADIVAEQADERVVLVRHPRNQGLPASLNTGFRHSTGAFCTWTSDDNEYLPDAIARMLSVLQTYPDVDFVYAESVRVDGDATADSDAVLRTGPPESLAMDNHIGACFLYTRAVYEAIGDYDPSAVLAEDYDYWVRISKRFTMQRLFRRLYRYRFHDASLTARHTRQEVAARVASIRRQHREAWSWPR